MTTEPSPEITELGKKAGAALVTIAELLPQLIASQQELADSIDQALEAAGEAIEGLEKASEAGFVAGALGKLLRGK